MPVDEPVVGRALALAAAGATQGGGPAEHNEAIAELLAAGDREDLQRARAHLVNRIYQRSDDYEATAALTLVNRALAAAGWADPYNWKHRRKP